MKFVKELKPNNGLHRFAPFIDLHPQSTWVRGPAFFYEQTLAY